jgi:hypothetical protein
MARKSINGFSPRLPVTFYLGTHQPHWLGMLHVPLFISRRRLMRRATFPQATAPWVLDSGGFTELGQHGAWSVTRIQYRREVELYAREIGLTVREHQRRTIDNYLRLSDKLDVFAPVIQGWTLDDYMRCVEMYDQAGVDLTEFGIVGVGSVCRRNQDAEIVSVLTSLADLGINLHAFGVKGTALAQLVNVISSSDSMAWSTDGRYAAPLPGCTHKNCANCEHYALRWRMRLLRSLVRADNQSRRVAA